MIQPQIDQDSLRAMGSRGLTFIVDKPYHITGNVPSWAFPEDNGFGPFLYGAFGSATSATVCTGCYAHKFSVVDTQVPSFTIWMKTGVYEAKASNCQVNKLTIKNSKASVLDYSADLVGSNLTTCTDFGTAAYITGSTKVFRSGGAKVFWDDSLSMNVDDLSITIDNGIDPAEAKALGANYAQHILAGNRSITGDMTIFVESTTELEDFWGSASGPSLDKATIPLMFEWEAAAISTVTATVGASIKIAGTGTPTLTTAGTYTGTTTDGFYEVKITTAGAQDKFKWRKDGGAWSSEINTTTTATTVAEGITVAFSATTGCVASDRWFFMVGKVPFTFMMYLPACNINSFQQGSSGNRLNAKVAFTAQIDGTVGVGFDAEAFLINTEAVAYSTV